MANPKKIYIVNLSCLHKLHPISTGIKAFTSICQNIHSHNLLSYLSYPYNWLWVVVTHYQNRNLINKYKLGQINTQDFLNHMLDIFYFLKGKENAHQLLINAWNSIIEFDDEHDKRLQNLMERARQEDAEIYLISNTNELNVMKILDHFKQNIPANWLSSPDISSDQPNNTPVKLADNIYLCASYKFGLFKSAESQGLPSGTPGLLANLAAALEDSDFERKNIHVVSQFNGDLRTADYIGIKADKDEDFFPSLYQTQQINPH